MLNKRQVKFLKYLSKPRNRSDVMKKFPKIRENQSIYSLEFSKYFGRLPGDQFQINDIGKNLLNASFSERFSIIRSLFSFILRIIEKLLSL